MRKRTKYIIIHCSATPASMDIGVKEIRVWHLQRGFKDVGYHKVLRRDGTVEQGRNDDAIGAHVQGFNSASVGICMIGGLTSGGKPENNFTEAQRESLLSVVAKYLKKYPDAEVKGHRDFPNVSKACPCFDVGEWWAKNAKENKL